MAGVSQEVMLVVKRDGSIVFATQTGAKLFGRSVKSLLRVSVFSLMPERIREGQEKLWALSQGAAEPLKLDALGLRDGVEFPLKLEVATIDGDEDKLYCVTLRDATPVALQDKQAQKMEALGLLAGGVAHDFNNALTAILGFAQSVKEDLPSGDQLVDDLDEVLRAASSAGELTQQLLSFARRRPVESTIIELNHSVNEIDKLLRRTLPASIKLDVESKHANLHVRFAPSELHQVLINLATNAKDAMPHGGELRLTLDRCLVKDSPEMDDGDYATLSIRDTGSGIAPESLTKIFDPFYSTKGEGGTGLGLSTCYGIARQSGGTLQVSSEVDAGTTFTLYMPLSKSAATRSLTTTEGTRIRRFQGVALVVEDQCSIRKYMKRTVGKSGLTTLVAASAEEALRLASSLARPPELLVSDIMLPGESGTELAVKLRNSFPDLKILLTSGFVGESASPVGLMGEATAFLPKPFTAKELRRRIELLLNPPRQLEGTILLIKSDSVAAQDAREVFANLGLNVTVMHQAEARPFLESSDTPPSLILISLDLAGVSARDILQSIRKRSLTATIPIVLLESADDKYDLECGNHTSVLSMPVTGAKLTRALERVGLTIS